MFLDDRVWKAVSTWGNEAEDEPMIGCAQLSLRLGKLGRVDEHGRVQPDDMDLDTRFARRGKPWCADIDGFNPRGL
jgi:hypothetical protein